MKLIIKYSILEELKESISLLRNPDEYEGLRSVISPSLKLLTAFAISRKMVVKRIETVWLSAGSSVEEAFKELELKDLGIMTCYIHGISCEGWFNPNDNSIHIRCTDNDSDEELLETIVHEIIHLSTYDNRNNYGQRETIVNGYLAKPQFKQILSTLP